MKATQAGGIMEEAFRIESGVFVLAGSPAGVKPKSETNLQFLNHNNHDPLEHPRP